MPLFTLLLGMLLVQIVLSTSLFWDVKGGRALILHITVQMLCWTLIKHFDEPTLLFSFGLEQTAFWVNILMGLVWVDWSVQTIWGKGTFIASICLSALSALAYLFPVDVELIVAGSQISCQFIVALMIYGTIRQQLDKSLASFLGGWLGLIAIQAWTLFNGLWSEDPVGLPAQLIGSFVVSCAASFRMGWLLHEERQREIQSLRDELQNRNVEWVERSEELDTSLVTIENLQKDFRQVSKDLLRSQAELIQQAKTTSLGHSSLQINQQLQGILTGGMNRLRRLILGLEENGHKDSPACQQLQIILQNMEQATQLTSSLQKFAGSRKEGGDSLLNVKTWLHEVVKLCEQKMLKSEILLEIKDEASDLWVKGKVADLMHALVILLNNACEALEYSEVKRISIEVDHFVQDRNNWLKITISDSGQGVPTNIRGRIFQPFFSTKHLGQGSGLGLTIASRIFGDHGGSIQLDAEALATTFIIVLPLQEQTLPTHQSPMKGTVHLREQSK